MKTEFVNNIAKEAIYQLQYDKKINLAHENTNKLILMLFSTKIVCLKATQVQFFVKF